MPVSIVVIAIILLAIIASVSVYVYLHKRQEAIGARQLLPGSLVDIEAIGGFSPSRKTALSISAVPGRPYNISLFSAKSEAPSLGGYYNKRKWYRPGEIVYARIGMSRF